VLPAEEGRDRSLLRQPLDDFSPYAAKEGWHMAAVRGNYRRLNMMTKRDSYPLINMLDFAV